MAYNQDDRQVSQGGGFSRAIQSLFAGGNQRNPLQRQLSIEDLSNNIAEANDPFGLRNRPSPFKRPPAGRSPFAGARVRGQGNARQSGGRSGIGGSFAGGPSGGTKAIRGRSNGNPNDALNAIESIFGSAQSIIEGLQASAQPKMFDRTLSDYLSQAGDGSNLISSQLAALEAQRASGRAQQQRGDSDIANMYRALQASLREDQASTADRYAAANKESINSSNAANQAIQQALTNAQGSQAETLANLGISDAGKQAAQTQADYNTMNTSAVATDADAARQALNRQGQAQSDLYGAWGTAAGFRGNERRADLQNELMQYLQGLAGEEAQLRDSAAQQARQMAQSQYSADQDAFYRQQEYLQGLDDRAYSRGQDRLELEMAQQQAQAEAQPNLSVDNKGGIQNAMNYLSSIGFRDPATSTRILQEVQNAMANVDPMDARTPRLKQMHDYLFSKFGRGNGTQYTAAINALSALLGSSGLNK